MPTRRDLLLGTGSLLLAAAASPLRAATGDASLDDALAALERTAGGRLGIALLDTGTGRRFGRRDHARFPMCSTFKALLAGAVLHAVDRGRVRLDQRVDIGAGDLVTYSPYVETRVADGHARVDDLCRATVTLSDNAAANLLLPLVGGPPGLTALARTGRSGHAAGPPGTRTQRSRGG